LELAGGAGVALLPGAPIELAFGFFFDRTGQELGTRAPLETEAEGIDWEVGAPVMIELLALDAKDPEGKALEILWPLEICDPPIDDAETIPDEAEGASVMMELLALDAKDPEGKALGLLWLLLAPEGPTEPIEDDGATV